MNINTFLSILLALQLSFFVYQQQESTQNIRIVAPIYAQLMTSYLQGKVLGKDLKQMLDALNYQTSDTKALATTFKVSETELSSALTKVDQIVPASLLSDIQAQIALSKIDEVILSTSDQSQATRTLQLKKVDQKWVVASANDYPAITNTVEDLLLKLLHSQLKDPIATKPANHHKLGVSQEEYARKLTIKSAGKEMTWWIGQGKSSAIHMRADQSDAVYRNTKLSLYGDLQTNVNHYMETKYFSVDQPTQIKIERKQDQILLEKQGDQWQINGFDPTQVIDQEKVTAFINQVKELYFNEVSSKGILPEQGFDQAIKVSIQSKNGDQLVEKVYLVGAEKDQHYFIKAQENDFVVKLPSHKVKVILEQKLSDFAKEQPKPEVAPTPAPAPELMPSPVELKPTPHTTTPQHTNVSPSPAP
jgi:hypothetical protein